MLKKFIIYAKISIMNILTRCYSMKNVNNQYFVVKTKEGLRYLPITDTNMRIPPQYHDSIVGILNLKPGQIIPKSQLLKVS